MIGHDYGVISAIYLALLLFGIGYNRLYAWLEHEGYVEGYTAFAVGIGCVVTLLGIAFISLPAALITLGGFVASGLPMIIGSCARYVRQRRASQDKLREDSQQ